jgi:hypothetical protein
VVRVEVWKREGGWVLVWDQADVGRWGSAADDSGVGSVSVAVRDGGVSGQRRAPTLSYTELRDGTQLTTVPRGRV